MRVLPSITAGSSPFPSWPLDSWFTITHYLSQTRSAFAHIVNLYSDFINCENRAAKCSLDLLYLRPRFLFAFSSSAQNIPLVV